MRCRVAVALCLAFLIAVFAGCGGNSKSVDPPVVAVTVSPATASVETGQTKQFTVAVSNTSNTAVTWQVNDVASGNATVGTISTSGLYTAPATVPSPATVTVKAVSQADTTKSATATVTVTVPPPVTITVSPTAPSVVVSKTQQFTANVTNANDKTVTWALSGTGCTGAACGTIDASGLYTAPASVPVPATVTVTATSNADKSKSATATVTITLPPPVTISVAPKTAQVAFGNTQQFTATLANADQDNTVTWKVNDVTGGDAIIGTIDEHGLYTAPASLPAGAASKAQPVDGTVRRAGAAVTTQAVDETVDVTISAVSNQDQTKSDTATVTITPPPPVAVVVSPKTADVGVNGTQQFTATVTGTTDTAVDWTLSGTNCTGNVCGVISAQGLYTAPGSVPTGTVTVTATSKADSTKSDTATVTVTAVNPSTKLSGRYVFLFSGYDTAGEVLMGGAFASDGKGVITGGVMDIRRTNGVTPNLGVTGSYTVGNDNRGNLKLHTSQGDVEYRFVLKNDGSGRFIEFDNTSGSGTHGAGQFKKQDSTALKLLNGDYVFMADGRNSSIGRAASLMHIKTNGSSTVTGEGDLAVVGYPEAYGPLQSGSMSDPDSTATTQGRMKLVLTSVGGNIPPFNLIVYMASANEGFLIDVDTSLPAMSGPLYKQVGAGTYTKASLTGPVIAQASGYDLDPGDRSHTLIARVNTDGAGGMTGTIDQNDFNDPQPFRMMILTGSYTVDPNGHVLINMSINGVQAVGLNCFLYDTNKALLIENKGEDVPSKDVVAGTIEPQTVTSYKYISGAFALGWSDPVTEFVSMPLGQLTFDDSSFSGIGDLDALGSLRSNQTINGTYTTLDGTAGRGTGQVMLPDGSQYKYVFYMVSPTKLYLNSSDPADANTAVMVLEQ